MMNMVGQQYGSYRLIRLLGEGGQASVYLAQHIRLSQKLAAIKIMHAHLPSETIESFRKEADTIVGLTHPHIVHILDFDVQQGMPFIVMEYYPDGTVRESYRPGERLPLPTVISYVEQVASALQYAHDHKIVHRDVKPANLLLGHQGALVLSDFGIATIAHSTSSMSAQGFAGTVHYMAPEQINAHPRRESDQYALAIVAYEWLVGQLPFVGTSTEIAIKHLTVEPPPLCQQLPGLSPTVEKVVLKALAKEPGNRFPSIQEFATALQQAVQSDTNGPTVVRSIQNAHRPPDTYASSPDLQVLPATRAPFAPLAYTPPVSAPQTTGNTPISARVSSSPAFASQHSTSMNQQDILRRVYSGQVPANWKVLRSEQSKVIQYGVMTSLLRFFAIYLASFAIAHIPNTIVNAVATLLLVAGIFYSVYNYKSFFRKNSQLILVLLPEGFVYGATNIEDVLWFVKYNNVVQIKPRRNHLTFTTPTFREVTLDFSCFPSPKDIAANILTDERASKSSGLKA